MQQLLFRWLCTFMVAWSCRLPKQLRRIAIGPPATSVGKLHVHTVQKCYPPAHSLPFVNCSVIHCKCEKATNAKTCVPCCRRSLFAASYFSRRVLEQLCGAHCPSPACSSATAARIARADLGPASRRCSTATCSLYALQRSIHMGPFVRLNASCLLWQTRQRQCVVVTAGNAPSITTVPAHLKSSPIAAGPLLRGGAFQLRRLVRSGLLHSPRCSSLVCCRICSSSAACSGSFGSISASNSRWAKEGWGSREGMVVRNVGAAAAAAERQRRKWRRHGAPARWPAASCSS